MLFIIWLGSMFIGAFFGWFIIAPMLSGFKPFTTPHQAVYEPEKHKLRPRKHS